MYIHFHHTYENFKYILESIVTSHSSLKLFIMREKREREKCTCMLEDVIICSSEKCNFSKCKRNEKELFCNI